MAGCDKSGVAVLERYLRCMCVICTFFFSHGEDWLKARSLAFAIKRGRKSCTSTHMHVSSLSYVIHLTTTTDVASIRDVLTTQPRADGS